MKNKNIPSLSLRKLLLSALVAAPVATLPAPLWALPADTAALNAQVISKTPGVTLTSNSATSATVTTTTTNSVINWANFGNVGMTIAGGDTLTFTQPSASAATLNLVTGTAATTIAGTIASNGAVYVVNKNGITVASGAAINTAGLGLSAFDEGLAEFNFPTTGTLSYTGSATNNFVVQTGATINVGSTGMVALAGNAVDVAGTITGANLLVKSTTGASTLAAGGALTVTGGNVTVTTAGGAVALSSGGATTIGKNLTVTSNGGAISIANGLTVSGTTATLDASGTTAGGAITQSGGAFTIGTGTANANLNLSSTGSTTSGAVTLINFGGASGKAVVTTINAGDTILNGATSDIVLNASTVNGALTVSTTGNITSGGNVAVKNGSNIALTTSGAGKNIAFATAGNATFTTLSTTPSGNISLTVGGNVSIPAVTATNLSVTAANITQSNSFTTTGVATFDASGSISLTNGSNSIPVLVLKNAPAGSTVADNAGLILANGTATTGNVTLTVASGNPLILGNNAASTIAIGGAFNVTTAGGSVTQNTDNMTVSGASTYTLGAGSLTLTGSGLNAVGLNNQYGQINVVSSSAVTVYESTSLNLGQITTSGNLLAYSKGDISNTGKLVVGGTTTVGAGTAAAPGAIALNWGNATVSNQLTGAVRLIDELNLLNNTAATLASAKGIPLANSVSISNELPTSFSIGTNIYGTTPNIPVTITEILTGTITLGALNTSGLVTLVSNTGAITANDAGNKFSNVAVTSNGGVVNVSSANALNVSATLTGGSAATATFGSSSNLTLGAISSNYTGDLTFVAGTGSKVMDSVSGIAIFGPVSITAPGGVSITQAGHNFGGVTVDTSAGNGSIALVESGTLRLTSVNAGTGNVSFSSSNGDVIQTAGGSVTTTGTASFSAVNGAVTLNQATNSITGAIGLTAKGNSTITQATASKAVTLGNVTVSAGTLAVNASGTGAAITQSTGSTINTFGATTFTNDAGKAITVANAGNRFGALTFTATGGGAVTVKELTTVNLKGVTAGTLSVTSEGGDIIDSGTITTTGAATFNAVNVTLDEAGSDYGTVGFTTSGNVSLFDATGSLNLAASTVGGTFQVSTDTALTQTGTQVIAGNTTFIVRGSSGTLTLADFLNQFGAIRFSTGTGGATIHEGTTLNLRGGSFSTGPVVFTTGGDFLTSGPGGSSINGSLTINAIGTIIPGAGSLLVTGPLTVNSANLKDLSQLSFTGNLNSIKPNNQGTGTYVPSQGEP